MIKILEVFGEPISHGGQESYVMSQLTHMSRSGFLFDFLTPYQLENKEIARTVESWGGHVFHLDLPFHPGKSREYIAEPLRAFFKANSYDVVHVHSGSTSVLAIAAREAKRCRVKSVIVHSHAARSREGLLSAMLRAISAIRMEKNVDIYAACSRVAAEAKYSKRHAMKALILNNGIDINKFSFNCADREAIRYSLGIRETDVLLGAVGRLSYEKNHKYLIDLLGSLGNQGELDYKLLIVGDGEKREELIQSANKAGLSEKIYLVGMQDKVERYLSAMDVFLMPSFREGLPISAIEAQANGLPCVMSTMITAEVDLLQDRVFHLNLDDKIGWIEQIRAVTSERSKNRIVCLKKLTEFDVNHTAPELRELYETVGA